MSAAIDGAARTPVMGSWTGGDADLLRKSLRMTNESFAEYLGVVVRTVAYWHKRPEMIPTPANQEILDTALERAPDRVKAQFALLLAERGTPADHADSSGNLDPHAPGPATSSASIVQVIPCQRMALDDIDDLLAQFSISSIGEDAIGQIEQAAITLAESHTQAPARKLLSQVIPLHQRVRSLLGGRLRLSQQRELYRVESLLLSHACLLLGDLNENALAERYGMAGLAFAREAGSDQAVAMTVLAKTFRWQKRLTESMDMARRGFACSPDTPVRVQLASQEANAAALLGDAARAREALARAERAAESVTPDSGLSAWSFPITRQAVFAQSVATQIGDADAMLQAALVADAAWSAGAPKVPANWAQIRVGAGIAHLLNGSLDGAVAEVEPVLALPPGMRVATVTAYTERLRRRLEHSRYNGAAGVRELGERLAQFNAGALSDPGSEED
jgi:DNA-binding transcriptional regulator YiaG/tetratricopeptide (TPR) repeat protein